MSLLTVDAGPEWIRDLVMQGEQFGERFSLIEKFLIKEKNKEGINWNRLLCGDARQKKSEADRVKCSFMLCVVHTLPDYSAVLLVSRHNLCRWVIIRRKLSEVERFSSGEHEKHSVTQKYYLCPFCWTLLPVLHSIYSSLWWKQIGNMRRNNVQPVHGWMLTGVAPFTWYLWPCFIETNTGDET